MSGRVTSVGYGLRYGLVVGGLVGAACAAVDGAVTAYFGLYVGHTLPIFVLGGYLVVGFIFGGFVGVWYAALAKRRLTTGTRAHLGWQIRDACLVGCAAVFAIIFIQRYLRGDQDPWTERGGILPVTIGIAAAAVILLVSARFRFLWSSRRAYLGQIACLTLFCILWHPFNQTYNAPLFSITSLAANAAYALVAVAAYGVVWIVLRRLRVRSYPTNAPQGVKMIVVVGVLGLMLGWSIIWSVRRAPIDRPRPPSYARLDNEDEHLPNIILIVLDTVRADHLSAYGYPRNTSPNLAAFAEEAVRYEHAIATSSWTLPSHASMFTELLPSEHGAHNDNRRDGSLLDPETFGRPLADEYVTLAEILAARSYATAAVIGNVAWVRRDWGMSQGFLYYDDRDYTSMQTVIPRTRSPALWMCRCCQPLIGRRPPLRYADEVNADVYAWLDREVSPPFFLFINYIDPHWPYLDHAEFELGPLPEPPALGAHRALEPWRTDPRVREAIHNYDTEIAFVDAHIGRLFDRLRSRGLYDDSLIVVVGDHGEAFGEHGLLRHGKSLYEEEVWVPLLIRYPGGTVRGQIEDPTSITSVFPTVLAAAGVEENLRATPKTEPRGSEVIAELHPLQDETGHLHPGWVMRAVYTAGGRKAITQVTPTGHTVVYDLATDPAEEHDISSSSGEFTQWAESYLDAWAAQVQSQPRPSDAPVAISDELLEQLRALGYIR